MLGMVGFLSVPSRRVRNFRASARHFPGVLRKTFCLNKLMVEIYVRAVRIWLRTLVWPVCTGVG